MGPTGEGGSGRKRRPVGRGPPRGRRTVLAIRLSVTIDRDGERSYALLFDSFPLRIGAAPHNDIVLDHPWVSGEHALVTLSRGELRLHDQSANGCWVDGMRMKDGRIGTAATVRIEPFRLRFSLEDPGGAERRTMRHQVEEHAPARETPPPARPPAPPPPSPPAPTAAPAMAPPPARATGATSPRWLLQVVEAPAGVPRGEVALGAAPVRIGRDRTADLYVPTGSVSRSHARLDPIGEAKWELLDLESSNGTAVAGEAVKKAVIGPGVTFCIGGAVLLRVVAAPPASSVSKAPSPPTPVAVEDGSLLSPLRVVFRPCGSRRPILAAEIAGRADVETASLMTGLLRARVEAGERHLVLLLKELVYVDQAGLRALMDVDARIAQLDGQLRLADLSPKVAEAFLLSRLDTRFKSRILPDERTAVASIEEQLDRVR